MGVRITDLRVYPVKSMGGRSVTEAAVERWGLAGDRRWGLVDDAGDKVTAREVRALLGLVAERSPDDAIRIRDRSGESLLVEAPRGVGGVPVSHARQGSANPASDAVNRWISERVGVSLRLVWQEDPRVRTVAPEHGGRDGDALSLADAGPLLLTSEASLAQLREWVGAAWADEDPATSMLRFRPNVVIDGEIPFAEDGWERVRLGEVELRVTEACDRCVMTLVHPATLARGKEPIATLSRHRRWDGKTWLGIRLAPLNGGTLRVGDEVSAAVG